MQHKGTYQKSLTLISDVELLDLADVLHTRRINGEITRDELLARYEFIESEFRRRE